MRFAMYDKQNPIVKLELDGKDVFLLGNVLSPAECRAFIGWAEERGFEDAPINAASGVQIRKDIRNNQRAMIDDPVLAAMLWQRVKTLVPSVIRGNEAVGLNERLRFYKYEPGQRFAPHFDGCFRRDNGEESKLTFMIYLNDDFKGGKTNFLGRSWAPTLSVKPEQGAALVFVHEKLHEGAEVVSGCKYVLRSDVMYF